MTNNQLILNKVTYTSNVTKKNPTRNTLTSSWCVGETVPKRYGNWLTRVSLNKHNSGTEMNNKIGVTEITNK